MQFLPPAASEGEGQTKNYQDVVVCYTMWGPLRVPLLAIALGDSAPSSSFVPQDLTVVSGPVAEFFWIEGLPQFRVAPSAGAVAPAVAASAPVSARGPSPPMVSAAVPETSAPLAWTKEEIHDRLRCAMSFLTRPIPIVL